MICALCIGSHEANAQLSPALAGRTAQANNAITINQNPAGMARLEGFQAAVDLIVAITDNDFEVDENQSTNTGGDPKNDLDWAAVPQFAASYSFDDRFGPFVDRWSIGFGVSVPQGFGTDYGNSWAGRYFAQETTLVFVSAQPVVAFRATDWLSIGAGASITYVESNTKVAFPNLASEGDGPSSRRRPCDSGSHGVAKSSPNSTAGPISTISARASKRSSMPGVFSVKASTSRCARRNRFKPASTGDLTIGSV
jgi:long-chain fatty acid transport protein